jgi:hypothetical protein
LWSDQLCAEEGGFWPTRAEYDSYPPHLRGQCKTIWRWFIEMQNEAEWLKTHAPGETDIKWFNLPGKE